jgi:hypothetical protein
MEEETGIENPPSAIKLHLPGIGNLEQATEPIAKRKRMVKNSFIRIYLMKLTRMKEGSCAKYYKKINSKQQ